MIPKPAIIDWEEQAPWKENAQIEQDLLLSRAIVEIFSDDFLKETLLFRGGTALYKLHANEPVRYSEDLDFVMIDKGPIGPVYDAIREKLDPLLGEPARDQKKSMAIMTYTFKTEFSPQKERKLKFDINYEEDFSILDPLRVDFTVDNSWYSGLAEVGTFDINDLMASKLRALFGRRKGRDLFDLWFTLERDMINPDRVLTCFGKYTETKDTPITRARFEKNLSKKRFDEMFIGDLKPLVTRDFGYEVEDAMYCLHRNLIKNLPGDPYQGEDNIFSEP